MKSINIEDLELENLSKIRHHLKDTANSIRGKTKETELLYIREFDEEIDSIEGDAGDPYEGPTEVIPKFVDQTLSTEDTVLDENITVKAIQVTTVGNIGGGNTLII